MREINRNPVSAKISVSWWLRGQGNWKRLVLSLWIERKSDVNSQVLELNSYNQNKLRFCFTTVKFKVRSKLVLNPKSKNLHMWRDRVFWWLWFYLHIQINVNSLEMTSTSCARLFRKSAMMVLVGTKYEKKW